jgi:phosphoglycerol transferase MdoB-like AlkP superfamily enzyme
MTADTQNQGLLREQNVPPPDVFTARYLVGTALLLAWGWFLEITDPLVNWYLWEAVLLGLPAIFLIIFLIFAFAAHILEGDGAEPFRWLLHRSWSLACTCCSSIRGFRLLWRTG